MFFDDDEDGWVDPATEVLQEDHFYPFGMRMAGTNSVGSPTVPNNYLFTGKEAQDELGIGWIDFGARMYDASVGRWGGVDALAENYSAWSPYNYVMGNPIIFIDPDGNSVIEGDLYNENGKKIGTDNKRDGRNFIVTDKKELKRLKNLKKSQGGDFAVVSDASKVKSVVELPEASVRKEMGKAVDRSNSKNTNRTDQFKGDDDEGGFHEEGGVYGPDYKGNMQVIHAKPGAKTEPGTGVIATVIPDNPADPANAPLILKQGSFHVHPKGTRSPGANTIGGQTKSFNQNPTNPLDFTEASNYPGNSYVLGAKGTVTVINGSRVLATFPLKKFIEIK
ncbi:MAG: RHS repeat-associated core domain-containing protein [Bacteroidota bacterium]